MLKSALAALALLVSSTAPAADVAPQSFGEQRSASGIKHSFLLCGPITGIVDEESKLAWESKGASRDGYVLPTGNVLISQNNRARELTRDGKEIWTYALSPENKELGTVVRLENGNTLVVERGVKPQLLEVAPDGSVAVRVPLQPETDNAHMQTRMARKLGNGNYLVPHLLAFAVKEYAPDGTIVSTIRTDLPELGGREARVWPFTAIRLADGNTLVTLTNGNRVVEFDAAGKVVWKLTNEDVGGRFADPCGAQRLANGNTVICSYGQKDPAKPKLLEVTRSGEVVWEYFHPEAKAHEVHVLTTNGVPEGAIK
jgi:outer membrane protein assembly factor BamB